MQEKDMQKQKNEEELLSQQKIEVDKQEKKKKQLILEEERRRNEAEIEAQQEARLQIKTTQEMYNNMMKKAIKMTKLKEAQKNLNIIICRHCHKKITSPSLIGLSVVCPYCKIPVNGQYHP